MKIADLLNSQSMLLKKHSSSALLDCELLLCHILNKPKSYLYSHSDDELNEDDIRLFQSLFQQRQAGKPIAYILGKQAFWNFDLKVEEGVLIPRPETECLVEKILEILPADSAQTIADLGTGTGALALAIAQERPKWTIIATDVSPIALKVAEQNASDLGLANIEILDSYWCKSLPNLYYDCIASNPPYIAEDDPDLEADVKKFEPNSALIAGKTGLECIEIIAKCAKSYLKSKGYIILEHGYHQAMQVRRILGDLGYEDPTSYKDYSGLFRFSMARR